jgi:tetratricopeptide (TPR) repeat protein
VVSDLRGAEKAFTEAASAFEEGTHDPLDRALLSRFQAHLMRARRRFAEAQRLQKRAVSLYRQCGETALAARVLADQGIGALYAGDPEKAMPLFEEALKLLDLKHDPRMAAAIRHNLAHCLSDLGLHDKALRLLRRVRAIYRNLGDELSLVRLRWLEGKVLHGLGQESLAEEALLEAREAFIDHDIAYDAALVSLDLASIYAAQGQPRKVRRLAEQMLPIFQSRDVHREALAALILFREAAKAERVTLALIREIGAYLEEARSHPGLAFRSSSS